MSTELRPARRHNGGTQPRKNLQRDDFLTLVPGLTHVFIVWREGARMPQSFHHTEDDAVQMAGERCQPGQRLHILRCEIVGAVEAARPQVNYTPTTTPKGGAA